MSDGLFTFGDCCSGCGLGDFGAAPQYSSAALMNAAKDLDIAINSRIEVSPDDSNASALHALETRAANLMETIRAIENTAISSSHFWEKTDPDRDQAALAQASAELDRIRAGFNALSAPSQQLAMDPVTGERHEIETVSNPFATLNPFAGMSDTLKWVTILGALGLGAYLFLTPAKKALSHG